MSIRDRGDDSRYVRDESDAERLDRNFNELLQELRVSQTGVQILFAFLLTMAFQQRFSQLTAAQLDIYLATLVSAALAAVMLIAPVATHRILFRHRVKDELVTVTSRLAITGLVFLLMAVLGAVLLIVDLVAGVTAAIVLTLVIGLICVNLWYVIPLRWRAIARQRAAR